MLEFAVYNEMKYKYSFVNTIEMNLFPFTWWLRFDQITWNDFVQEISTKEWTVMMNIDWLNLLKILKFVFIVTISNT